MSKILIKNLSKTFEQKVILSNINLQIENKESLVIIGGSGSGKSVLIKCIAGLILPDLKSSIIIDGDDVSNQHISLRSSFLKKFSLLFQGNALFDSMSIWENITFGMNIDDNDAKKIAEEKLEMVEIDKSVAYFFPNEISGGMQKRVALARAVASNPQIIFFDEPTSGLDPATSKAISNLIKNIRHKLQATTITITHDAKCMKTIADKVAVIENGKISWSGYLKDTLQSDLPYIKDFLE